MKIENYVFFSVSYRYICRHPKQNLAMALYRLESDRTQIGIDLDTKTRDNDLRHPDMPGTRRSCVLFMSSRY